MGKATWMRSLRLFRITKVLRVLRVVKTFKELQLIMNCITGSLMSMVWSVVMLGIMYYMFSLMLVLQTGLYLSEGISKEDDDLIFFFGSVRAGMWTLFKATFGGDDWQLYYVEVEKLGFSAAVVWFLFVVFTQVALMNILTGIFVESALQLADGDAQSQALKHEEKSLDDALELARLCREWDRDQSNLMSKAEFVKMSQSDEFSRYVRFIGLDISNITSFFDLISDPEEKAVSIKTFVASCMRLRGWAKSADMLNVMLDMKTIQKRQERFHDSILAELRALSLVDRTNGSLPFGRPSSEITPPLRLDIWTPRTGERESGTLGQTSGSSTPWARGPLADLFKPTLNQ